MESVRLSVSGMHCASCGMLIDDAVEDLAGVNTSATNVGRKQTVVEFDPTKTTIREITAAIDAVGYRAVSA